MGVKHQISNPASINANVAVRIPSSLFVMPRSCKPIPNGKIYIGRPGTDPTQLLNQIPVYYANESGVMVQVAQPLVINNAGYPVYTGVVTDFLTEGSYAMAVYNTSGMQKFYFSNIMPSIAGGQAINLKKFLTVPETSVEALPDVNMRKNKLLCFDAYSDPIAIANQTGQYNPVEIALTPPRP
ncbi:MAG: phage tailspike protein [Symbiopectobacterium sp.]|uniref:phage tailspike protein n=1 Tax=Symbiopectobacterium sp. TaxID=2952789 RepID=UPI003F2A8630